MRLLAVILALGLAGCASGPRLGDYNLARPRVELVGTPFFPQEKYQCGPAALATVLAVAGVDITPAQLTLEIYLPHRQGSLQAEIVAATRRHGLVPYVLNTDLGAVLTEVNSGNPVLIMQNLGLAKLPQWHYAVVIGYDAPAEKLLLRSGTTKRLEMNRVRFTGAWARAGNWAMVAAAPDQPPVSADSGNWLRAASAFEELNQSELAAESYEAATRRWSDQALTWQVLANARYALNDMAGAEVALRRALALKPSAAGHNNLAHVLLARGCRAAAAREIDRADAMADTASLLEALANTRAAIDSAASGTVPSGSIPAGHCVGE